MTHLYNITGMTCSSCSNTVEKLLSAVPGVTGVLVDLKQQHASISMEQHIPTQTLQQALATHPKYVLSNKNIAAASGTATIVNNAAESDIPKTWFQTYKPIILIFIYLLCITILPAVVQNNFELMTWMPRFMAGFFLTFSFFKMLNLQGFAESYSMYDVVGKQWPQWGYVYAFAEAALGILFLLNVFPLATNIAAFVLMSVSIIGVLQSVLNKQKIKCACLGDVFNLPMSTVTIIEDALMIAMSGYMIVSLLA